MSRHRVISIVGTRPEVIKMATVVLVAQSKMPSPGLTRLAKKNPNRPAIVL